VIRQLVVSASLFLILTVSSQAATLFEDQFSGTSLKRPPWVVLHENNPGGAYFWLSDGLLHTTTLQGDFIGRYSGYKNLFVIPNTWGSKDFAVTIRVLNFVPYRQYQQIQIMAYDDDNNYIKIGNDYWAPGQHWEIAREVDGVFTGLSYDTDANNSAFYLRMVKRGKVYTGYYSLDGHTYHKFGNNSFTFGDGSPTAVGFCAFQGENETQTPVSVQVEFFRLETLPAITGPNSILLLDQEQGQQQQ
jgi:regulation of enolase protein 1 (concanavalin A-like superfamily)